MARRTVGLISLLAFVFLAFVFVSDWQFYGAALPNFLLIVLFIGILYLFETREAISHMKSEIRLIHIVLSAAFGCFLYFISPFFSNDWLKLAQKDTWYVENYKIEASRPWFHENEVYSYPRIYKVALGNTLLKQIDEISGSVDQSSCKFEFTQNRLVFDFCQGTLKSLDE